MGKTRCMNRVERALGHPGGRGGSAEEGGRGGRESWGEGEGIREAGGKGRLPGRRGARAGLRRMDFATRIRRERYPGRKEGMNQGPRAALPKRTFCDDENFSMCTVLFNSQQTSIVIEHLKCSQCE